VFGRLDFRRTKFSANQALLTFQRYNNDSKRARTQSLANPKLAARLQVMPSAKQEQINRIRAANISYEVKYP
jgi:hypothetical protein